RRFGHLGDATLAPAQAGAVGAAAGFAMAGNAGEGQAGDKGPEKPAAAPQKGPTSADTIAEQMGPGHFRDHGDPSSWRYLGKKAVPAAEPGRQPGSTKVYEVFLDENGKQIEWHYWLNPNGTVDGGKVVFPGTTSRQGLAN